MRDIFFIAGTRPEVIKLAPVYHAAKRRMSDTKVTWISTGQHREMLEEALRSLGILPDIDLNVMEPNQSLAGLTSRVLSRLEELLETSTADLLVVQGDTTTAMASAICGFCRRLPVAHVEAGLRTHSLDHPFPEEGNRRIIGAVAALHFAPTRRAADNLVSEGVSADSICVTGNTVVDALLSDHLRGGKASSSKLLLPNRRLVLVTSHRREAWGADLEAICRALLELRDQFPDIDIVYPVHLNPNVRRTVMPLLDNQERITLLEPLGYFAFLDFMRAAYLILTDSGGVQEEAPTFGVPVLVLREVTERPEAVESGLAQVVGVDAKKIVTAASSLLNDRNAYVQMSGRPNPFGDGRAAERIVNGFERYFNGEKPLLPCEHQFDVEA